MCGKTLIAARLSRHAINDAGVIQRVRDHHIVFGEDRCNGAGVGREPRLEHDHGFRLLELGKTTLEFHVNGHGAGDGADGTGADAKVADGLNGRFDQLRMRGQSQVVVRGQIDDRPAVELRLGLLTAFEDSQRTVETLLAQGVEFGGKKRKRVGAHPSL